MLRPRLVSACLLVLTLIGHKGVWGQSQDEEKESKAPIRALLVTGGSSHDYQLQQRILTSGIRQRLQRVVEWKVQFQGDGRSDVTIPFFENSGWSEGYDIVVHNYCFPRVHDTAYVDRILAPHGEGLPAVLLHATMQSFRTGDNRWFEFCGVETRYHATQHPIAVTWLEDTSAISKGLSDWLTPKGELYQIENVLPGVKVLGKGQLSDEEAQPIAWTHAYGANKAPVFATSLGNDPETMNSPVYLDLVARGLLWALGDLEGGSLKEPEEGSSRPGIKLPDRPLQIRKPGRNLLSSATVKAHSTNVADGYLGGHVVDGDLETFWESERPGPSSLEISLPEDSSIGMMVVEWVGAPPVASEIEVRSKEGEWKMVHPTHESKRKETVFVMVGGEETYDRVRITVSATNAGEKVAIREVSAFEEQSEAPAAYLVDLAPKRAFHSSGATREERAIQLRDGWTLREEGLLPAGFVPSQLVETASGVLFLIGGKQGEPQGKVLSARKGDSKEFEFTTFLEGISRDASAVWDGEWLYVLEGFQLTSYRDTNDDGKADERFQSVAICSPRNPADDEAQIYQLQLTIDGWCYGIVSHVAPSKVFCSRNQLVEVPQNGLIRFRRDGSRFEVVWESADPINDFFRDTNGSLFVSTQTRGGVEKTVRLNRVSGPETDGLVPILYEPVAISGSTPNQLIREQNRIGYLESSAEAGWVANIYLPVLFSRRAGTRLIAIEREGGWSVVRLSTDIPSFESIDLDEISNQHLVSLLKSGDGQLRMETGFEIQRRRMDLTGELRALLDSEHEWERLAALSVISQIPGRAAFQDLLRAARKSEHPLPFQLLGDRLEAKNHKIFSKITRVKSPAVSASILSAILQSGTKAEGLNALALSMAATNEPEISTAAKNFLLAREASDQCFAALDDPRLERIHETAFKILTKMPKATVAEGIVLRLEKTNDPAFRRAGLRAVCDLYYAPGKSQTGWKSTPLLDAFLQASLSDHRVDREWLLDEMKSRKIPVSDPDLLLSLAREDISLEPAVFRMVGDNGASPDFAPWLQEVTQDSARDSLIRIKALRLLLPMNTLPFRDAFALAANYAAREEARGDRTGIYRAWKEVNCPEEQIPWLPQKATSNDLVESTLAWITFLKREEAGVDDATRLKIEATLNTVLKENSTSLIALLRAAELTGDARLLEWAGLAYENPDSHSQLTELEPEMDDRLQKREGDPSEESEETAKSRGIKDVVDKIQSLAGSIDIGWDVFRREGCATCHNIHGEGPMFGPDIVKATAQLDPLEFVSSILKPGVKAGSGYGSRGFELRNGVQLHAIVEERRDQTLLLRDSGGNAVELERSRVRWEWGIPDSLMHGNFEYELTAAELASLRAFLLHLSGKS